MNQDQQSMNDPRCVGVPDGKEAGSGSVKEYKQQTRKNENKNRKDTL